MGKPILIIEDDRDIRETLTALLELKGYEVTARSSARQALAALQDQSLSPHLILLDLMMPDMDGWEFRRRQLADPSLTSIPVVVITGAQLSREEAISLQALDVLSKPVDISRMLDYLAIYAC